MNQVNLCGYLGKDFELKYTPNGSAFAKTTLGVSENRRNEKANTKLTQVGYQLFCLGVKQKLLINI